MYIGIDLGTSAVKLLLMNKEGIVEKIVSKEYPLYTLDGGWSEQDPDDWLNKCKEGIKELVNGFDKENIKAISFSGQMHGLVILDNSDKVIRRAILWNDQRTQKQCDFLNEVDGRKGIIDATANIALTGFTSPKILWVKENEPDNFAKIDKIMLPKDYLAYKLSGIHCTDYSDASGMCLLDVSNKKWSDTMLKNVGITKEMLPKLFNSYESVGNITNEMACELGLSTNTKIVIGGGDQAVGAVGTSAVENNMCSISLGTSGVVFVASDEFKVDYGTSAIHSFCHATGKYHLMGVTLSAAASYKWWQEEVLNTTNNTEEQQNIHIDKLGKNKVFFLPYLSGERTPHNDADAKGAFIGMNINTSRFEMTQAVMEGVIFSLLDVLEVIRNLGVDVTNAKIIGGGAKSTLWCQMAADILGITIQKINSDEGPALGAAILAAVGDGAYEDVLTACKSIIKVTKEYTPRAEITELYKEKHKIYKELYLDLKDSFKKM